MLKKNILTYCCFLLIVNNAFAQKTANPRPKNSSLKKMILPASLLTLGFILNKSKQEKDLNKSILKTVKTDFYTNADDYLVLTPGVIAIAANIAGIKAKNHWFDQGKNVFIAVTSTYLITTGLKQIFHKTRPDLSNNYAMPSGHSALSFAAATVLYEEYKDSNQTIAYSGFATSSAVVYLRMANNRHWISDTLVGAGIGIAVAKLVYLIEPLKNFNPFKHTHGVTVFPTIHKNEFSISLSKTF